MNALTFRAALTGAGLLTALSASAQTAPSLPRNPLEGAPSGTVVQDDDGGKVEIIPVQAPVPAPADRHFHGGTVLRAPQVQVLFVGTTWSAPSNGPAMRQVNEGIVAYGVSERFAGLKGYGLDSYSFQSVNGGLFPSLFPQQKVSDLAAQHLLAEGLRLHRLAAPSPGTLYVLMLAPGLVSTLGSDQGGARYAAYHSAYHDAAGLVRYAVIPYAGTGAKTLQSAERALVAAILNPDGDGWY